MSVLRGLSGGLLIAAVALAPAMLGSNRPLPWALNALLIGAALALVGVDQAVFSNRRPAVALTPIALPAVLMGLAALWIVIQALPAGGLLPAHPVWSEPALRAVRGAISVDPDLTLSHLGRLATAIGAFLAAYWLARDEAWAALLLKALVVSGLVYALYGLAQLGLGLERVLWFPAPIPRRLTSGFIGPNNAATYFGLAAIVAFGLFFHRLRRAVDRASAERGRYRIVVLVAAFGSRAGLAFAVFVALFTALLLTASRAGIAFTVAGLVAILGLQLLRRLGSTGRGGATAFAVSVASLLILGGVFELAGADLVDRLVDQGLDSSGRLDAARVTLSAIADHALIGAGYGTFQDLFPLYRSDSAAAFGIWDKAHNDYLELFLGLGVPAALAFLAAPAILFARVLKGCFVRRRRAHYAMIGVAASLLVALQSAVDFSLQIQAVALAYALVLGVAVAQARSERNG